MTASGIEVAVPGREDLGAVTNTLAEAFLDDPVWIAAGPRRRRHRALANRAAFWGIVHASRRQGARMRLARERGDVVGATIAFAPGTWPIPDRAAVWELGWVLLAGPAPLLRGLRDDRAMRATHVEHPHTYLWFLGVAPARHGRGVGRELMAELHADSDRVGVPTYLETGTESNRRFYRGLGYELLGEIAMPSGARLWRMERRPGAVRPPS